MTHFIEVDSGWVNASLVARIEYQKCRNPGLLFYSADKSVIGKKTCHSDFDPSDLAPIVPAAPGSTAVIILVVSSGDRPNEVMSFVRPIVAWRIVEGVAIPVLTEKPASSEHILIRSEDGTLTESNGIGSFKSVQDAESYFLRDAQQKWDPRIRRVA
jgi:hypothetical protein